MESPNTFRFARKTPVRLNANQRKAIRRHKRRNPTITQTTLAQWCAATFKLPHPPSQGAISIVLSNIKSTAKSETVDKDLALAKFERRITTWMKNQSHVSITSTQKKAKRYAKRYLRGIITSSAITREWTLAYIISHQNLEKNSTAK